MNWSVALRLGRVSNLPTVWTNVCAGVVLSGAAVTAQVTLLLIVSLSLFYIGGMFLNDAFDQRFDRREQPYRPIPAGEVTPAMVFAYGFGHLAFGLVILCVVGYAVPGGFGWRAPAAGALLAAIIVLYDAWHKANPIGPLIMGLCRLLVYLIAGLAAAGALPERLLLAAIVSLCYLIGLTYAAKQESLRRVDNVWPLLFLAVPFVYGLPLAVGSVAHSVSAFTGGRDRRADFSVPAGGARRQARDDAADCRHQPARWFVHGRPRRAITRRGRRRSVFAYAGVPAIDCGHVR
jgi:4-hydroxybenzoate polyprenyltransferase